MIETTKQLDINKLKDLGLVGIFKGNPAATGTKAIYNSTETLPDSLGSYVMIGQAENISNDTDIQNIIDSFNYEDSVNENKLNAIRIERNKKLNNCDWVIMRDDEQKELIDSGINITRSLTDQQRQDWLQYRQDLRDFPANVTDLDNPNWPTEPSS